MLRKLLLTLAFSLVPASMLLAQANSGWVNNQEGCWCGYLTGIPRVYRSVGGNSTLADRQASADMLSEWNKYVNLFTVQVEAGTVLGSNNGINEINTFMTSTQSTSAYGFTMSNTLYGRAVFWPNANFGSFNECQSFSSSGCGPFTEADVVNNLGFADGWTNNWYDDGGPTAGPALIQTTALHEAGHTLGLHHIHTLPAFGDSFSTMNYMNDDSGKFVTRMDARTVRTEYSTRSVNLTDIGIFPFVYGNGQYAETYTGLSATTVAREQAFSVNNWLLQNIGTANASTVTVAFYLWPSSAARYYPNPATDYLIGTASFGTVNSNAEGDQTGTPVMATYAVPNGTYWIGAIARVNGSEDSTYTVGKPNNNRFIIGHNVPTVVTINGGPSTPLKYNSYSISDASGNNNGFVDPGEPVLMPVTLLNQGSSAATGISATLSTSTPGITITDTSATWANINAGATGTSASPHFAYTVGAGVACGTQIQFTLTVTSSFGTESYTFTVPVGQTVTYWSDTFSTNKGWTLSQSAATGNWERADPEPTQAQPGNDSPNDADALCLVTDATAGTAVGDFDVDGTTAIDSPAIDLSAASGPILTYDRAFFSGANADTITFAVSYNNGGAWTTVETLANFSGSTYSNWTTSTIDLSSFGFTPTTQFKIRITAADGGAGSIVEGLADNIKIVGYACTPFSSGCTAPGAPNLTAATGTCTGVDLAWAAGTGTTNSYNIYRVAGACGGAYAKIAGPVTGTTYSDTTAVAGTAYAYVVRGACDAGGATESGNSNCRTATRLAAPAAPAVPTFTSVACTTLTVNWTAVSGAVNYDVYRRNTSCGAGTLIASNVATTSYNDTGLTLGATYAYYIVAKNTCGSSANGACTTVTLNNVPAAAAAPTLTAGCTNVGLSWTAVSGATDYEVWRNAGATCAGATQLVSTTSGATTYNNTGLTGGTQYSYFIVAKNACGPAANGACATATTLAAPAAPAVPTFTSVGCTTLTVNWTAVSGAVNYDVYRRNTSCGAGTLIASNVATTSYDDTGLAASSTYAYYIVAKNTCGSSANGACTTVSTTGTPAAPAAPTVTDDCSGLNLSWGAASGATSYNVYRRSNGCGANSWVQIATGVAGTTYSDTTAALTSTYGYYIEAVNTCGSATSGSAACTAGTHNLTAPTINVTPNGTTTVCINTQISFSCAVTGGSGSYTYQWTEDGANLGGQTAATLNITKASAQSHTYNCVVTDTAGCSGTFQDGTASTGTWATTAHSVNVTPNGTTSVCVSNQISFSAGVTGGTGPFTYQWTEDGTDLGGQTAATLNVTKATAQSHTYNCRVVDTGSVCSTGVTDAAASTGTWTACAPNIVFVSATSFTELNGDGDAYFDQGERWSVLVTLQNTGTLDATNVSAALSANGITVCNGPGAFGSLTAGGGTGTYVFQFVVSSTFASTFGCGTAAGFDVTTKACTELTPAGADEADAFSVSVGKPGTISDVTLDYTYAPVPASVPHSATTDFTLNVPDAFTVTNVDVDVNLVAPSGGNAPTVTVELISPAATAVTLYTGAPGGWTSGTYSFANNFDGENSAGNWILRVTHSRGGGAPSLGVNGTLNGFVNHVTHQEVTGSDCSYVGNATCSGTLPIPVPDGVFVSGSPMTAAKTVADGSAIALGWDVASCTSASADYHLLWGSGSTIASYTVGGGSCDLGTTGSATWTGTPAVAANAWIWFVIVGDDNGATEGSWGQATGGAQRSSAASGQCGMGAYNDTGTCN